MSHSNIYRHFPSKQALLDAVVARWLHKVSTPLQAIADDAGCPAGERLAAWFDALRLARQNMVRRDPELFQVYQSVVEKAHAVADAHATSLLAQLARIIADGVASGEFAPGTEAPAAARAFLMTTVRFHHPAMVAQDPPPTEQEACLVFALLLAGLRAVTIRDVSRAYPRTGHQLWRRSGPRSPRCLPPAPR